MTALAALAAWVRKLIYQRLDLAEPVMGDVEMEARQLVNLKKVEAALPFDLRRIFDGIDDAR